MYKYLEIINFMRIALLQQPTTNKGLKMFLENTYITFCCRYKVDGQDSKGEYSASVGHDAHCFTTTGRSRKGDRTVPPRHQHQL